MSIKYKLVVDVLDISSLFYKNIHIRGHLFVDYPYFVLFLYISVNNGVSSKNILQ